MQTALQEAMNLAYNTELTLEQYELLEPHPISWLKLA
jgi:hypothetical protein